MCDGDGVDYVISDSVFNSRGESSKNEGFSVERLKFFFENLKSTQHAKTENTYVRPRSTGILLIGVSLEM